MAQRGAKLTIHGRRKEKLDELANQIEEISGTKVYTLRSHPLVFGLL